MVFKSSLSVHVNCPGKKKENVFEDALTCHGQMASKTYFVKPLDLLSLTLSALGVSKMAFTIYTCIIFCQSRLISSVTHKSCHLEIHSKNFLAKGNQTKWTWRSNQHSPTMHSSALSSLLPSLILSLSVLLLSYTRWCVTATEPDYFCPCSHICVEIKAHSPHHCLSRLSYMIDTKPDTRFHMQLHVAACKHPRTCKFIYILYMHHICVKDAAMFIPNLRITP